MSFVTSSSFCLVSKMSFLSLSSRYTTFVIHTTIFRRHVCPNKNLLMKPSKGCAVGVHNPCFRFGNVLGMGSAGSCGLRLVDVSVGRIGRVYVPM
jgi:hypothetical protein